MTSHNPSVVDLAAFTIIPIGCNQVGELIVTCDRCPGVDVVPEYTGEVTASYVWQRLLDHEREAHL